MSTALQVLNLLTSCATVFLLWQLFDRLDPFKGLRDILPMRDLHIFRRFMGKKRSTLKRIPHTKAEGQLVPLFNVKEQEKLGGLNYYVPKDALDADPFTADYYPSKRPDMTPLEALRHGGREWEEGIPPDSYVVDGHVIPGATFRELYEVARVAVRLDPAPTTIHNANPVRSPVQKVTFSDFPKTPSMTEEEQRKLAEEYDLVDREDPAA